MTGPRLSRMLVLLLPTLLLTLSACGGGGGGTTPPPPGTQLGQGSLTNQGGILDLGPLEIEAPAGALITNVSFEAEIAALPLALPTGASLAGSPIEINITSGADALEQPVTLTFHPENGTTGTSSQLLAVAHYDAELGKYEATTPLAADTNAGTVTVESRAFSIFVPIFVDVSVLPPTYDVDRFAPNKQGWSINNFGNNFAPGGNCLGMAAYSIWFHDAKPSLELHGKYAGQAATIMATRAHMSQSQYWTYLQDLEQTNGFGEVRTGDYGRGLLFLFNQPLLMRVSTIQGGHIVVCYGYDATGFKIYDVNHRDEARHVDWNGTSGFTTYSTGPHTFDRFAFISKPSLGRGQDFEGLFDDGEVGFHGIDVSITDPVDVISETPERNIHVKGTVDNTAWTHVSVFVAGRRYDSRINGGAFDVTVPLKSGDNDIVVLAGQANNFRSSFIPGSGVAAITVKCTAPSKKLFITLNWFNDDSDVDLYTYGPTSGVAWYTDKGNAEFGFLDVDDTQGRGPEHFTIGNTIQPGPYRIRLHYYKDSDSNPDATQVITGKVEVMINEGDPDQKIGYKWFSVAVANDDADGPSGSGPSWVEVGTVNPTTGEMNLIN